LKKILWMCKKIIDMSQNADFVKLENMEKHSFKLYIFFLVGNAKEGGTSEN
jgi:hypothetical protein